MKRLLLIVFLCPLLSVAQVKPGAYIIPSVFLKHNFPGRTTNLGAGLAGGVKFAGFGAGAGVEYFKVYKSLKGGFPLFADLRYYFNKTIGPAGNAFVAANAGKFIWNVQESNGGPESDYAIFYYKGKAFLGFEAGLKISKVIVSLGAKRYGYDFHTFHHTTRSNSGGTMPAVETISPSFSESITDFTLKLGIQL